MAQWPARIATFVVLLIAPLVAAASHAALPFSEKPTDLRLQLTPVWNTPERYLSIRVTFDAAGRTRTPLVLPTHWAGVTDMYRGVRDLRAVSGGARIVAGDDAERRVVTHSKRGPVTIGYSIVEMDHAPIDYRRFYLPLLRNEFAHFFGHGVWVLPEWHDEQRVNLSVTVTGLPKDWMAASSFGAQPAGPTSVRWRNGKLALEYVRHSLFVLGDFRLHRASIQNNPVWIAIRGRFAFDDDIFVNSTAALIQAHRDFFGDHAFPHLLLTLMPIARETGSYGGTSILQGFAMHVSADFAVPGPRFDFLIGHEHLHTWMPARFGQMGKDEALRYWFSEGFTNYLTHRLLVRAGQWSLAQYAQTVNAVIRDLELSEARDRDNEAVLQLFFKDQAVGALPYQRGELLALRWDSALRAQGRSLASLLRGLVQPSLSANANRTMATERLLTAVSNPLGDSARDDVTRFIDRGQRFEYTADLLGPCFSMRPIEYSPTAQGVEFSPRLEAETDPACAAWITLN